MPPSPPPLWWDTAVRISIRPPPSLNPALKIATCPSQPWRKVTFIHDLLCSTGLWQARISELFFQAIAVPCGKLFVLWFYISGFSIILHSFCRQAYTFSNGPWRGTAKNKDMLICIRTTHNYVSMCQLHVYVFLPLFIPSGVWIRFGYDPRQVIFLFLKELTSPSNLVLLRADPSC